MIWWISLLCLFMIPCGGLRRGILSTWHRPRIIVRFAYDQRGSRYNGDSGDDNEMFPPTDRPDSRPRRSSAVRSSSGVIARKPAATAPVQNDKDPWKVLIKKLDSTKSSKQKFGKLDTAILKSATVATPDILQCKHFGVCAGCTIKGNFTMAPIITKATNFFNSENVKLNIHYNNKITAGNNTLQVDNWYWQWRTHVKLAVQPLSKWGGLKIGLYKAGSHEVEAIPDCRVHHPRINEAVEELKKQAIEVGVKGYYQDSSGNTPPSGELRYVQMTVERESGKVQLVLVWNSMMYKDAEQTLPRLVKKLKSRADLWHSITVNFQTSESNTIFNYHPKAWKLLWGPPTLRERIGNVNFFFRPQIFRQANLDAFQYGIIPLINAHVPASSVVAELYSGIGVIGLNVAASVDVEEVTCSDNNEYVDEVFDKCADSIVGAGKERVFYEQLSASDAVLQGQVDDADVLIVDPPRRGLDSGVLDLLVDKHETAELSSNLKRIIYVSCGFEALESDTRSLLESGLWRIKSADGFVLFPGSDHVETVVIFDRVASNN